MNSLLLLQAELLPPASVWEDYKLLAVFLIVVVVLFRMTNKWHADKEKSNQEQLDKRDAAHKEQLKAQEERHSASVDQILDKVVTPFQSTMKEIGDNLRTQGEAFQEQAREFRETRDDLRSMRRRE